MPSSTSVEGSGTAVTVIGHTISIRSAGVMAAQASGSLSPRVPTHSEATATTVSSAGRCPFNVRCGDPKTRL